ncbi:sulfite exporter TauE/SafE family protein [Ostreiculturibacter nitratireducens]|uniref:sulfite exporter TauE/SafE family protein n=1 Tax=Ostreiculturibacter nitratireducens TaxID=3075226 RepID=UPI0031B63451
MPLPFDLSAGAAAILAGIVLLAAFVRGYSGFGFPALVVTSSSLITDPRHMIPVVIISDLVMTVQQWPSIRRHIDWRRALWLSVGAIAGVPLGLWALAGVGADAARALIAGFVLCMCLLLLSGWYLRRRPGDAGHAGAGLVSGIANAAAVGGLPVVVFFAAQGIGAAAFRATLVAYFTFLDIWTVPLMNAAGMVGRDTFIAAALTVPLILVGARAGGKHFLRTSPESFRRFAILLLTCIATLALGKSIL